MRGVYRFYQNGELLATSENLITAAGKPAILKYLSGEIGSLGEALAIGVATNPAALADTRLGFEIDRVRVELRAGDVTTNSLVFKTTIPQYAEYTIHEIGLFNFFTNSPAGEFGGGVLTSFDASETWTSSTPAPITNLRAGAGGIIVSPATSQTLNARVSTTLLDLSGYSADDYFSVAFWKSTHSAAIGLTFDNPETGGSFKHTDKSVTAMSGYNILTFRKGDFVAAGGASWDNITRMSVDVRGGSSNVGPVTLDAIRVEDADTAVTDYALISRSVLTTPLVKTNVAPMDIEYAVGVNIG